MNLPAFLLVACALLARGAVAQAPTSSEQELYAQLMEYRKKKGLPAIPLSPSLTTVAQMHARDLADNDPVDGKCNLHSWSNKGKWVPCCYTDNHEEAECMWNKPRELTAYPGYGYEIAWSSGYAGTDTKVDAEEILEDWKSSDGHHAVIINADVWRKLHWNAIGIGIYKGYAVVWFGEEADPATGN
ncbi:MAG: CAP domain-containing protein [Flavobacteriales bacterium]